MNASTIAMKKDMTAYHIPGEDEKLSFKNILISFLLHLLVLGLFSFSIVQHAQLDSNANTGTIEVNLVQQSLSKFQSRPVVKPEIKIPDKTAEKIPQETVKPQQTQTAPVNQTPFNAESKKETNLNTGIKPDIEAKPSYLENPTPFYPESAKRSGFEGTVLLTVMVDQTGHATDVKLKKTSGFSVLDESAIKTVRKWKFTPALLASMPVESSVVVPIRFRLTK